MINNRFTVVNTLKKYYTFKMFYIFFSVFDYELLYLGVYMHVIIIHMRLMDFYLG
jgi:hypothetical protein